jgi:hypothetical protein
MWKPNNSRVITNKDLQRICQQKGSEVILGRCTGICLEKFWKSIKSRKKKKKTVIQGESGQQTS